MSTRWDLKCTDCNEWVGLDLRRPEEVAKILQFAEALAKLSGAYWKADIEVSYFSRRIEPEFFEKHLTHKIEVVSEYGEVFGTCAVMFPCGECGHHQHCVLDRNHDGGHSAKKPGSSQAA